MRLFIAADIPPTVGEYLRHIQEKLLAGRFFEGTFTRPENFHITLLFLGECPEDKIPLIIERIHFLREQSVCTLQLTALEVNQQGSPSIIWARVLSPDIEALAALLRKGLALPEDTKFIPHITLARVKTLTSQHAFFEFLENNPLNSDPFCLKDIKLKQSILTQEGPIYHDLYTCLLKS